MLYAKFTPLVAFTGPTFTVTKSARFVSAVVTIFVLLPGLGSTTTGEVATALLLRIPVTFVGVTVTVKLLNVVLAKLKAGHPIVPFAFVPPPVAPTNVTPTGRISIALIPVAALGPLLVTAMLLNK